MNRAELEALVWSQARNLTHPDALTARTAMEAVMAAVDTYADDVAGRIVAARRRAIQAAWRPV